MGRGADWIAANKPARAPEVDQAILCARNRMAAVTARLRVLASSHGAANAEARAKLESEAETLLAAVDEAVAVIEGHGETVPEDWKGLKQGKAH